MQRAFSLIETLVVITILALLAALLFPVIAQAKARAGFASCTSNLRQLGTAIHLYQGDHDGRLPLSNLSRGWDDYGFVKAPQGVEGALEPYGASMASDGVASCPVGHFSYNVRFVFTLRDEFGSPRVQAVRQIQPEPTTVLAACVHHLSEGYSRSGNGYTFTANPHERTGREIVLRGDGSVRTVDTRTRRTFQVSFEGGEKWKEIVPYRAWGSQTFPNTDRVDVYPGEAGPPKWIDLWSKP